ncbi:hypothetical protein GGF50DRAFT_117280 [Schizophyllum commune]
MVSGLEVFMDDYVQRPDLRSWVFPAEQAMPPCDSSKDFLSFYKSARIPTLSRAAHRPCLLIHQLGSFSKVPELQGRVNEYFSQKDTCLCNASGSGKTRLTFEGLCAHWGFYIVCRKQAHMPELASEDLSYAIQQMKSDRNFHATLTGSSTEQMAQVETNRQLVEKLISAVLLARAQVFKVFLDAAEKHDIHMRDPSACKKSWLMLQIDPALMKTSVDYPEDIFLYLTTLHLERSVDELRSLAMHALDELHDHSVLALNQQSLFVVLDEVQDTARDMRPALRQPPDSVSLPAEEEQSLLWELVTQLVSLFGNYHNNQFVVLSGTSLTADEVANVIEGASAARLNRGPDIPIDLEGSQWIDTLGSDMPTDVTTLSYDFDYIGGFERQGDVVTYTSPLLPHELLGSDEGAALQERMFKWLRGRYKFIVSFLVELMMRGLKYPHQQLDEYICGCTGIMPSDGHLALLVHSSLPMPKPVLFRYSRSPLPFDLISKVTLKIVSSIDLTKLHDTSVVQDWLLNDVRLQVLQYMIRGKQMCISGASAPHAVVRMGIARYGGCDWPSLEQTEVASNKSARKMAKLPLRSHAAATKIPRLDQHFPSPAAITEPLVLLALHHHFDTWHSGMFTTHHYCGQNITRDGSKDNGWEDYLLIALLRALSADEPLALSKFLRFVSTGDNIEKLGNLTGRLVGVVPGFYIGECVDNTRPGYDSRSQSGSRHPRRMWCGLGAHGKSPEDTLKWFKDPTTPIFFPDTSCGPDLALRVLLSNNELVWIIVQAKLHVGDSPNLTSAKPVTEDAIRSITPVCLYEFTGDEPKDERAKKRKITVDTFNNENRANLLKSLDDLPCRTTLAGTHSVIRVLAYIPTLPRVADKAPYRHGPVHDPDDGDHPLAELDLYALRFFLQDFEPKDAMAEVLLRELSKFPKFQPPQSHDLQEQYDYAWQFYLGRRAAGAA